MRKILLLLAVVCLLLAGALEDYAFARAGGSSSRGGGFSGGSRGSRTFSAPQPAQKSPTAVKPQPAPPPFTPVPQPAPSMFSNPFMRGLAGGIIGGFVGGMLFRGIASAFGMGGMPTGVGGDMGIGLFDILLLGAIGFLIYRFIKARRNSTEHAPAYARDGQGQGIPSLQGGERGLQDSDLQQGLTHISQMDGAFDEKRFALFAADTFKQVQTAWSQQDETALGRLLSHELRETFRRKISSMEQAGLVNRMESVSVIDCAVSEAWQEQGSDYLTVEITASAIDYTTDQSGQVTDGDRTTPVTFTEYWTYTRPVGTADWRVSAIQQPLAR